MALLGPEILSYKLVRGVFSIAGSLWRSGRYVKVRQRCCPAWPVANTVNMVRPCGTRNAVSRTTFGAIADSSQPSLNAASEPM